MFRDAKEELARLEKQLLEEEEETCQEEDYTEEYDEEYRENDLEDGEAEEMQTESFVPRRAYNSDRTDVDLEQYSQEVQSTGSRWLWYLVAAVAVLMAAAACVLVLMTLKVRGVL